MIITLVSRMVIASIITSLVTKAVLMVVTLLLMWVVEVLTVALRVSEGSWGEMAVRFDKGCS